jgi:hypothetical protein
MVRVAAKFEEQHPANPMIAIPGMRLRNRFPTPVMSPHPTQSIVLDVVDDLQEQKRKGRYCYVNR